MLTIDKLLKLAAHCTECGGKIGGSHHTLYGARYKRACEFFIEMNGKEFSIGDFIRALDLHNTDSARALLNALKEDLKPFLGKSYFKKHIWKFEYLEQEGLGRVI